MKKNKLLKLTGIVLCLIMLCGVLVMTASAEDDNVITTVHIYGIDGPVPGKAPDFSGTTGSSAYCIIQDEHGVYWSSNDNSVKWNCDSYGTFVKGTYYKVKVYIEPEAGYEFPTNAADITAYFGGGKEKAWVYKDSNGYYVQQSFDKCGEILTVAISTAVPEVGAKPEFKSVWEGRYYSYGSISPEKEGVKWYDETEKKYLVSGTTECYFKAHHTYTVSYSIYAVDPCEFGNASAFINGKRAQLDQFNPIVVDVKYTFETGCDPEFVEGQFPTCGGTGHVGYYACSCGNWYWDASATEPITDKEEVVIPPTGAHSPSVVGAKASTCTVKGYTGDKVCLVCKTTIEKGKEIALKAHTTVKDAAVPATYKSKGKTEGAHCSVCKAVISKQTETPKLTLGKTKGLKVKSVKLASGTKTTLTLAWNKVDGAEKYEVYQQNGKKWTKVGATSKTTLTVKKLKANKSYKFRVRAVLSGEKPGAYGTLTAKTVPLKTTLTLKAGKKQLTASWKEIANITGYEVAYSTSKKFTKKTTKTVTVKKAKTKKATIKKLSKGKKYYVKVRAYKTVGKTKIYSAWSSVKNVKVK
ncbi:MAG: fibronectin type III domain-containing protein [Clostridia bacterium]|nr:fibronectin type III domain-containing protein [Clostridia bacterium]